MEKITFIHTADLHLDAPMNEFGGKAAKRRNERFAVLKVIIELCRKKNANMLLIAGDLFDSCSPDPACVRNVSSLFASLDNTQIFICAGNHDYLHMHSPFTEDIWSDNVHIFGENSGYFDIPGKNCRVHGVSFNRPYITNCMQERFTSADSSMANILVMHGDTTDKSEYNPMDTDKFSALNMNYTALGHIHKRSEPKKAGGTSNSIYAYSGSPEPLTMDEYGEKGVYFGTIENGKTSVEFIPVNLRTVYDLSLDVSGCRSDFDIYEKIFDKIKNIRDYKEQMLRLTLSGRVSFIPDISHIKQLLSEDIFFVRIHDNTFPDFDVKKIAEEFSLRGKFAKRMLEKIAAETDSDERETLENALYLGLLAFETEVEYREDK